MANNSTENSQTTAITQTFRQFVESRLLAVDFNKLPEKLNCSLRRTNISLNHPRRMELETIQKLNKVLGGKLLEVIDQYKIGYDRLTAAEYKGLLGQQ
ncbi:hypothetical protein [Aureispira sp. CCB-E]|uniref:hypothetical protein n=1 Tax=Aureispira sp. CCB-E TaxID=3051121 RepID=UPI0028691BE2|nr:hypothetical protein [Aureispira sp. CCB-E]WMX12422.1 hypothetical protein QP953_16455 [Aureispira sp. CCB-E]